MLFNSYIFVFIFLPIVLVGFTIALRHSQKASTVWLVLASFFFYGYWNPPYVLILIVSTVGNFLIGGIISRSVQAKSFSIAQKWTFLGVLLNLLLLCYYKYSNFFVENAASLLNKAWQIETILLPIGISFYTFTQIAYLIDCRKSISQSHSFLNYSLFVSFFPQLIAGPILHHKEIVPQFKDSSVFRVNVSNLSIGLTVFAIGLFKKVVLADGIAPYATPVFSAAETGVQLDLLTAWGGTLAYTFQLYFDFSGYSDMAIGLSRMFGIVLPLNFASPYKARSISDFWRRWHITLSRFLREYLYIPLGGSRSGSVRRALNLFITMLLGGIWHGAGWTYIVWGMLHGLFLVINHIWRELVPTFGKYLWQRAFSWLLTFVVVVFAWAFFRAETLSGALTMVKGMVGMHGLSLPNAIMVRLGPAGELLTSIGFSSSLGGGGAFVMTWCWILALLFIVLVCPNTQQIVRESTQVKGDNRDDPLHWVQWKPNIVWAVAIGLMISLGIVSMSRVSEFLYFQF